MGLASLGPQILHGGCFYVSWDRFFETESLRLRPSLKNGIKEYLLPIFERAYLKQFLLLVVIVIKIRVNFGLSLPA